MKYNIDDYVYEVVQNNDKFLEFESVLLEDCCGDFIEVKEFDMLVNYYSNISYKYIENKLSKGFLNRFLSNEDLENRECNRRPCMFYLEFERRKNGNGLYIYEKPKFYKQSYVNDIIRRIRDEHREKNEAYGRIVKSFKLSSDLLNEINALINGDKYYSTMNDHIIREGYGLNSDGCIRTKSYFRMKD